MSSIDVQYQTRRRWGLGDVAGGLLSGTALALVATALLAAFGASRFWLIVASSAATWIGMLGWVFIACYAKGSRSLRADFGVEIRAVDAVWGVVVAFGMQILAVAAQFVAGHEPTSDPTLDVLDMRGWQLVVVAVVIVAAAPVEEIFFRGLFLRAAERRLRTFGAVVVTSATFGLMHVPQRWTLGFLAAFLPLFVVGAALAFATIRFGRLGPSIVAHSLTNLAAAGVLLSR